MMILLINNSNDNHDYGNDENDFKKCSSRLFMIHSLCCKPSPAHATWQCELHATHLINVV